jgi:hypothetical protein
MGARGLAMAPAEWPLLKLAAERIGAEWLLPAWREGALRSFPSKAIAQKALQIGAAKLNQTWLERTLPLRGIKRWTDEEVDIPSSVAGRLVLNCGSNCLVRLSSQGLRRLTEYHSVKARPDAVERLEREARARAKRPKATKRDREKEAARVEAARVWREKEAERARVGAERAAEWLARETERKVEEAKRAAEERALEAETSKATKRGRGRPLGQTSVAMTDAKMIDDFGEPHLRDILKGTMTKPSIARRLRAARAARDANK